MKTSFVYFLIFLTIYGCHPNPGNPVFKDFKKTETLNSTTLTADSSVFINPEQLLINDSILYVVDPGFDKFVVAYDLKNKKVVNRIFSKGRGDGEFSDVLLFNDYDSSRVRLFDHQTQTIYEYSWNSILEGNYQKKSRLLLNGCLAFETIKVSDSLIFFTGIDLKNNCQYFSYNVNSNKTECIYEYPDYIFLEGMKNTEKGMAMQAGMVSSPDKKHILAYYSKCGVLDLFNLSDNGEIKSVASKIYFDKVEFTPASDENMTSAAVSRKSKLGFIAAYSSKRFVYVLYSNKTVEELTTSTKSGSHILCYNWNGTPINHYKLDTPIQSFCLQDNVMYGISINEETYLSEIVKFDL
jgi:hypothetical protein